MVPVLMVVSVLTSVAEDGDLRRLYGLPEGQRASLLAKEEVLNPELTRVQWE